MEGTTGYVNPVWLNSELFSSMPIVGFDVFWDIFLLISENKAVGVMKSGHVFTIEPMICEGEYMCFKYSICVLEFNGCKEAPWPQQLL
jgi:hypothetical protein